MRIIAALCLALCALAARFIVAETAKWGEIVRRIGLRMD
jgi:hypothetical protein